MKAVLPAAARPLLEPALPPGLEVSWFRTPEDAAAMVADAEIAWIDMTPASRIADALRCAGPALRWVNTLYAGLDALPLELLRERGVTVTNGTGVNAIAVAEYAVMGMLVGAKRFDQVLRAQDSRTWLKDAPGKIELFETDALVIGYGAIGRAIGDRLAGFGVRVTGVTRSGRDGTLRPDQWQAQLGAFDWIILAAPSTGETKALIGAAELAAMKRDAWLVNIARGDMIDDDALVAALKSGEIGGAFLDPTHPEPLPAEHPLWGAPNCLITMHLSGRSQTRMFERAGALFLENLEAFMAGRQMRNVADLSAGY